jgi:hypothetical protein
MNGLLGGVPQQTPQGAERSASVLEGDHQLHLPSVIDDTGSSEV